MTYRSFPDLKFKAQGYVNGSNDLIFDYLLMSKFSSYEIYNFIISFSLKIILKNQNQLLMLTVDGKCICEDQARRVFNLEKTERPMNFHSAEPLHIDTSFIRTTL